MLNETKIIILILKLIDNHQVVISIIYDRDERV